MAAAACALSPSSWKLAEQRGETTVFAYPAALPHFYAQQLESRGAGVLAVRTRRVVLINAIRGGRGGRLRRSHRAWSRGVEPRVTQPLEKENTCARARVKGNLLEFGERTKVRGEKDFHLFLCFNCFMVTNPVHVPFLFHLLAA